MPKVRGRRSSFNVRKVMWLIGEFVLDRRHIEAGSQNAQLCA
jgi:glutathione S-transferase